MNFKNHLFFSIFFIFFFVNIFDVFIYVDLWHMLLSSVITCLLPDLDHPKSILGIKTIFLSFLIFNCFGHRNITHSFLFLIFIFFFLFYLNFIYLNFNLDIIIGMILGYLSHIIADLFTYRGISFFWPLNLKLKFFMCFFFYHKNIKYYFCIIFFIFSFLIKKIIFLLNFNYY